MQSQISFFKGKLILTIERARLNEDGFVLSFSSRFESYYLTESDSAYVLALS